MQICTLKLSRQRTTNAGGVAAGGAEMGRVDKWVAEARGAETEPARGSSW